ncbi:hypothetical protein EG329_010634 [Mollisiaceae sp. DMI_Dod_QoI]|nr:hypothetical protein EG329_010634 [Helotiales sp. DMI_Dod_QoI]
MSSTEGHGKRSTAARSDTTPQPISKTADSEETADLQFVNTTNTATIDESSKRVIRKQASRHGAKPTSSGASTNPVATTGQVHRFRLGPKGMKHTSNQPRQIRQKFTILSLRPDEQPSNAAATPLRTLLGTAAGPSQAAFTSRPANSNREEEDDELFAESVFATAVGQPLDDPSQEESLELVGWATEQHKSWLSSLLTSRGVSLYGPSSNAMDPFNAMALTITPREQVLVRYYFTGRRQLLSPLIPYCQVWFGLAVQDKAAFHAVLSHYSATHRSLFQHESPTESISHLSAAIQAITERLQDQKESCSNGTIGAVASLIIYESANGALPSIDFHMKGLQEMVRRRGGFEQAGFPMDLKRLIAWTDLNTANDLWQPPRFSALKLPTPTDPAPGPSYSLQQSSRTELQELQYTLSSPLTLSSSPNLDIVLSDLKSFATELKIITRSITPLNRPRIEISDRIHFLERQIFDIIHKPAVPQNALDHACAVAALIYIRSNVRDTVCNFRIVETAKLQIALQSLMELDDMWTWGMEMRNREKLVWTVGFGAVSSTDRPERPWFVGLFRDLCDTLELRSWEDVKAVFETVLWKDELDESGVRLWEEMQLQLIGGEWNMEISIR